MAEKMTVGGCASKELSDNHIRWLVYGIALNQILVPSVRPYVEGEIQNEYTNLKSSHNIDTQISHNFHGTRYPEPLNYENINGNDTKLKGKKYDPSKFDYKVTSHVDFAKLFLQHHMAKFNAFDGTCDASAVLILLGRVPVFSAAVQKEADDVRAGRNTWGHCNFSEWNKTHFQEKFDDMKNLVQGLGLKRTDESKVLEDLKYWEMRGVSFCVNADIDNMLVKFIQERVNELEAEVKNFSVSEDKGRILKALGNVQTKLRELEQRVADVEQKTQGLKQDHDHISADVDSNKNQITKIQKTVANAEQEIHDLKQNQASLKTNQEILLREVNRHGFQTYYEISSCEGEINFFAKRHDPATRQWLIEDFESWFKDPGDSRAYVLLGDPAVGKTVMAAVLAQRATKAGYLGAAYFCRHNDPTRNNPRYLLGTIANQLSNNCPQLNGIVCGEGGIQSMLANPTASVTALFTKLLQEPLSKYRAHSSEKRKLVVIDGLDETEYDVRDDFLDLIMNRFPLLPKWLVFFITSRPEDNVRLRLKTYNPCIKICAGNSDTPNLYEQHEKDIVAFLDNEIGSLDLPCSIEEIARGCSGSFLHAHYITVKVKNLVRSGNVNQLNDTLPQNIDDYFRENFKRVCDKVGKCFYEKIFACAVLALTPLPISFIPFILQRENLEVDDEQSIIDAVSQFLVLRDRDETLDFLHNLIPAWLTDKKRASRNLFIDRSKALEYFKEIVVEILSGFCDDPSSYPRSIEGDVLDYVLRTGIGFLSKCGKNDYLSSEVVFKCLTNYEFIMKRMKSNKVGIYSFIEDLNLSVVNQAFDDTKKEILHDLGSALTRDIYVLLWCPELLHSCLRNASQKLSGKVITPDNYATSLIESISIPGLDSVLDETVTTMECFALSHDKTFFAGAKEQCVYLFDAHSLKTIQGPIQVTDEDNITCVAFSQDDNHVFFGRLDRWLSVQEQRIVEVPKFARNSYLYKWGCFVCDDNFIVVERSWTKQHNCYCLEDIFCEWARCEFLEKEYDALPYILDGVKGRVEMEASLRELLRRKKSETEAAPEGCPDCREFQSRHGNLTLRVVRERVVDLYPEIFNLQVWNVETGRPAIEEIFCSGNKLDPFFYSCHIPMDITRDRRYILFRLASRDTPCRPDMMTPGVIALINSSFHSNSSSRGNPSFQADELVNILLFPPPSMVIPVEYRNRILSQREYSQNGEWFARYADGENIQVYRFLEGEIVDRHLICGKPCGFSSDNGAFVYCTSFANEDLNAISLQTGNILHSVSGLHLFPVQPTGELGFIFRGTGETKIIHFKDLPMVFLNIVKLQRPLFSPIGVTFISMDTVICLSSVGTFKLFDTKVKGLLGFYTVSLLELSSKEIHIKKCAFAAGCHTTAIYTKSEVALFQDGKFLCPVIEKIEDCSVPYMKFSPDGRFFLFCLERSTCQVFHVWDVKCRKDALPEPIELPDMPRVDCCCFSPDNTKLFFCHGYSVLEYSMEFKRSQIVEIPVPGLKNDDCSHCIVSSVDEFPTLACCIADKIFIYPLAETRDGFWEVPHGHLGRVEFCQFLKGNRYLISYGVDGFVFLTDLFEWKSIAYARTTTGEESIVNITVSPKEDKVVCLKSNEDLSVVSLHGLTSEVLSKLYLPELDRTQSGKQLELGIQNEFDEDDMIIMSDSDFSDFDEYESETNEDNEDTK